MKTFEELGVRADLIKGLDELGIVNPTEAQESVIPLLLQAPGDLVCQAQTGTGKTAAFGLPILHRIDPQDPSIQALILAPTRELAKQIAKHLFRYTKYSNKVFTEAVTGGEKIEQQINALRRPTHIVVATPGRLLELLEVNTLSLSNVRTVVLDEADEMLSMGFRDQLDAILERTQQADEKWLFSATIPTGVRRIIEKFLSPSARKLQIDKQHVVNRNIEHTFTQCSYEEKTGLITRFINAQQGERGVIFCRMRAGVVALAKDLAETGISVDVLHGELSQKERDRAMRPSARSVSRFWCRQMSPRAGSTSRNSLSSFIISFPTKSSTTPTGAAEPPGPAEPASRSPS